MIFFYIESCVFLPPFHRHLLTVQLLHGCLFAVDVCQL